MCIKLLFAVMVVAVAAPVQAGSLDLQQVSADAQWMAHVDVDAFWASQAAQGFLDPLLATKHAQAELKKFHSVAGFDPRRGLHSITLYGDAFKPRRGVIIMRADAQAATIAKFLAKQPDYKKTKHAGHVLLSWTDRHHGKHTVIVCLDAQAKSPQNGSSSGGDGSSEGKSSLLVMAHRMADMREALDVLDGKAPSLADADSPLSDEVKKIAPGTAAIVTISASGLAEADPFKSPVIRQCKSLHVALGEKGDGAFIAGRLVAKSAKSAGEMEQVLEGLLAMGRLAADTDENLQKILSTVKVSLDGKTVVLQWHGQVADVILAVQRQWIKRHMKKSNHKKDR